LADLCYNYKESKILRDVTENVPEQFIWYIFECLCIVGLLLERGEVEKNPMIDWVPIVHRDMKMANVFLSYPDEKQYKNYPVPKLGDFGLAIYLPEGELTNHEVVGTPGNLPVEQDPNVMRRRGMDRPLTAKANVWAIANIVASMVVQKDGMLDYEMQQTATSVAKSNESVGSDEPVPNPPKRYTHTEPEFDDEIRDDYSEELLALLYNCMRFDPNDRISLSKALKSIRAHRHKSGNGFLREEPADSQRWDGHRLNPIYLNLVCCYCSLITHVDADFCEPDAGQDLPLQGRQ
jgi:serine/threonine protein kinase